MENLKNRADIRLVNNKKDSEVDNKTTLCSTKNIWQRFGRDS